MTWDAGAPGVLQLPSGRLVRGRGLRRPPPEGPEPQFALYLLGRPPEQVPWTARWVRWPDFRLPADHDDAWSAFAEAWFRAEQERVEIACGGGRGRTGTALACLAVLDGVPADEAVAWVREHYDPHAVETPMQARFVRQAAGMQPTAPPPRDDERVPFWIMLAAFGTGAFWALAGVLIGSRLRRKN